MVASQRRIRRTLDPLVAQAAATPGADRYRKRFSAFAHLWVLLVHLLWGSPSLRITHARLTADVRWWQRWGMTSWISLSQLARSSSSRPSACVEALLAAVVDTVRRQPVANPLWHKLRRVVVLDSTFLRLSAATSPWSVHGGFVPGARLQTLLELGSQIPHPLRLTLADVNDHTALWELDLSPWQGWTLLVDRGYYGHQQFTRLIAAGVHVIARCNEQAAYRITRQRQAPTGRTPDGDEILADWTVTLGSPNNRRGAVVPGMRLVTSRNRHGKLLRFVTDRHDLTATEIVQLYRKRWQIELFFRWLKQQLGLIRPLGKSRAAVWLTILMVMIVALLVLMLEVDRPHSLSRVAWIHHVAMLLLPGNVYDG